MRSRVNFKNNFYYKYKVKSGQMFCVVDSLVHM